MPAVALSRLGWIFRKSQSLWSTSLCRQFLWFSAPESTQENSVTFWGQGSCWLHQMKAGQEDVSCFISPGTERHLLCFILKSRQLWLWKWHLQWFNIPTVLEIPPANSQRCSILVAALKSLWMPIVESLTWMRDLCEEVSHHNTMCYSLSIWLQLWVRLIEAEAKYPAGREEKTVPFILRNLTIVLQKIKCNLAFVTKAHKY